MRSKAERAIGGAGSSWAKYAYRAMCRAFQTAAAVSVGEIFRGRRPSVARCALTSSATAGVRLWRGCPQSEPGVHSAVRVLPPAAPAAPRSAMASAGRSSSGLTELRRTGGKEGVRRARARSWRPRTAVVLGGVDDPKLVAADEVAAGGAHAANADDHVAASGNVRDVVRERPAERRSKRQPRRADRPRIERDPAGGRPVVDRDALRARDRARARVADLQRLERVGDG